MILCKTLFVLALLGYAYADEVDVLDLTDDDFSTIISDHETALVMFYAPWCGHCKKLKPEYAKAAGIIKDNDPPVALAKVDCTEGGKETCNKFGVTGYPTLKIFRNGEMSQDYNGPREAAGIVKHLQSQVGPSSKELTSVTAYEEFIGKKDVVVIGFFEAVSDLKEAFMKLTDKLREKVKFAHTEDSKILAKQGETDAVVLFYPKHLHNKFEPAAHKYEGPNKKEDIEAWINKNYHGLVGHRQRDNTADFKNPLIVAYYGVDYEKNPKGTNYWRNRILKVAKNFAGFNFGISAKDDFQHELNEFGYDYVKGDKPIVFARDIKNQKFIMKDEFSVEAFEKFLTSLQAGELDPYLKSEPIPDDNSGPVKVAVAKNFDEVITNNGKDTLIEFYAPWCGHCKKLGPIYDELGEKLKDEDVAIVKIDASNNDVPGDYEVRGFPTLYWAPKNSKSTPVRYEGGREVDDFINYIAKHATTELSGWDRNGKPKKGKKEEL